MKKKPWVLVSFIFFVLVLSANQSLAEAYLKYQLQPGEDVGYVLHRLGLKPVWSDQGSLTQTVKINPQLKEKYSDFELPALTWINLPIKNLPSSEAYKINNGIVTFTPFSTNSFLQENTVNIIKRKLRDTLGETHVRDIVIHFHKDSLKHLKNNSNPIEININFYNARTEQQNQQRHPSSQSTYKIDDGLLSKVPSQELSIHTASHSLKMEASSTTNSSQASIFSDQAMALAVSWKYNWTPLYSTRLNFSGTQYKITDSNGANLLEDNSEKLFNYSVTNTYHLTPKLSFGMDLGFKERYFLFSKNGNPLLNATSVFSSNLKIDYNFLKWGQHILNSQASIEYAAGKKSFTEIKNGYGYSFGIGYQYQVAPSQSLGANFNYLNNNQSSEQYKQNTIEAILSLTYQFTFGEVR